MPELGAPAVASASTWHFVSVANDHRLTAQKTGKAGRSFLRNVPKLMVKSRYPEVPRRCSTCEPILTPRGGGVETGVYRSVIQSWPWLPVSTWGSMKSSITSSEASSSDMFPPPCTCTAPFRKDHISNGIAEHLRSCGLRFGCRGASSKDRWRCRQHIHNDNKCLNGCVGGGGVFYQDFGKPPACSLVCTYIAGRVLLSDSCLTMAPTLRSMTAMAVL